MMKKIFNFVYIVFVFVCALFMESIDVSAKKVSSSTFEVEVGTDKLPVYYSLEDDYGVIKERMQFAVTLKGLEETGKSYRWEHKFCYKVSGQEELCETDLTGKDQQENPQDILSSETYSFQFWDGDMPYYSEGFNFEYVKFSNKLVCIDDGCNEEIILDDIEFVSSELDYNYQFLVDAFYTENNGKKYVDNYFSQANKYVYVKGYMSNNISSSLTWDNAPTFLVTNSVCVGDNICRDEAVETVSSGNQSLNLTPYLGNFTFYYSADTLLYDSNNNINYEYARFKTVVQCQTNCNSRFPDSIVLLDEIFYFDTELPTVDEENTSVASIDEYAKSVEVKITVDDSKSGIDPSNLFYQIIVPYYNTCDWGQSYNFAYENGVSFILGPDLNDGPYCMRYYAYDYTGNYYVSDYYIFYFDNNAPSFSLNKDGYIDTNYYNQVNLEVNFTDYYSGIDSLYYLWSKEEISEEDYLVIKNNGKSYDNNGVLSSNGNISEDGTYYLYFVAYDKLGNYKYYSAGRFNFDTVGLTKEDVEVITINIDEYHEEPSVKIIVEEMSVNETFKCAFLTSNTVKIEDLNLICTNNTDVQFPNDLEGEYSLWVYVHDRAYNYTLLEVETSLFIDTSGPRITYSILKEDDAYYITNSITLIANDGSGLNGNIKYGWFKKGTDNVTNSLLENEVENGGSIGYPVGCYGEYKLYVSAMDNLGNEMFLAIDKIFKVDTDIIRISLVGEDVVTIIRGQKYEDAGAKAYKGDVSSGGRVSSINIDGNVDTKKAGVYYITYSSGDGDLLVSVTRKVIVKSDTPYLVAVFSIFVVGTGLISFRLLIKKKKD